jgi:hypothetical protein
MKLLVKFIVLIIGILFFKEALAQNTIHLQPGPDKGKDAIISYINPNNNSGNLEDLHLYAWTHSGELNINRSFVEFDLSEIPTEAIVEKAFLELYFNPTSSYWNEHYGENSFFIKRITSQWDEDKVNWINQPTTSNENIIYVPISENPTQDYKINVTVLLQDMLDDTVNSHGFCLQLCDELPYKKVLWASSDHTNSALWPTLTVTYYDFSGTDEDLSNNTMKVYPNPAKGNVTVQFGQKNVPKHLSLMLYDDQGKLVWDLKNVSKSKIMIKTGSLSPGLYLLKAINDKNAFELDQKIVIK